MQGALRRLLGRTSWRGEAALRHPGAMTPATTRTLDLLDDDEIAAFHRVRWASLTLGRPHVVPSRLAEFTHSWRSGPADDGWRKAAVGTWVGGELVSVGWLQESVTDALDTVWVGVHTAPERMGEGHGSRVLAALAEVVGPGRTRALASVVVPSDQAAAHGYRRFAERAGATLGTSATTVELALPVVVPPDAPPAGYRLETHVDGVPVTERVGLGILKGLVDAEAPSGEIAWDPTPVSPEHYAREIEALTANGGHALETIALDDRTGEVVAFTEMAVHADPGRPVSQEGTLVRVDHRGRGLGRAVKLANLRRLQEAFPEHERVWSESDDENTWMHAVNAALGFTRLETILYMTKEIG